MESFVMNYRDINIKVECNSTIKNLITENLKGHVNFLDDVYNETYRLVIADEINGKGIKGQMVDKWFDNAMLDCYIDNTNRICYATNFRASTQKNKELLIQYFVANLFYRFLEIDGYIGIHSACVETDNKGILFVADRMSGKTNCILNLMHDGFNFVANKKVALKKCEDDIIGYGVSQPVSIRLSPSFCSQPQNYKYVELAKKRGIIIKNEDALEGNNICIDESELVKL